MRGEPPAYTQDMELWPMVLEKAYAKVHHNWDAIDGGFAGQAVKDMTGAAVTEGQGTEVVAGLQYLTPQSSWDAPQIWLVKDYGEYSF